MDDAAHSPLLLHQLRWLAAIWSSIRIPLVIVGFFFVLFLTARIALLLIYPDQFQNLKGPEFVSAFVSGARFDASIIFSTIAIPLFFMLLPFAWAQQSWWQGLWGWFCFVLFLINGFIIAVDLAYFDFVSRHIGPEIGIATDDLDKTLKEAFGQYLVPILVLLVAAVGLFFLWRRLLRSRQGLHGHLFPRLAISLLALALMYSAARGGFGENRILVVDAYDGVPPEAVNLVLSGPFTANQFMLDLGFVDTDFYPWEEALATTQQQLISPEEEVEDPDYPLYRRRGNPDRGSFTGSAGSKPNVVVIMLEGWSAISVGAIREEMGLGPRGLTSHFDALCLEGVLLYRFFATGQRTRYGVSSMLTGLPNLPALPALGKGLEQSRLPYLSHLARREGYETFFFHGKDPNRKRRDSNAAFATGFEHYLGLGDIETSSGGIWDHDLFAEANRRFSETEKPFLGFIMTLSPHAPYETPDGPWNRFPAKNRKQRYWNALGYADWALGQYFLQARKEDYFENTIFIIASDHTQSRRAGSNEPSDLFRIPGLVIAPGLQPGVYRNIASQVDLIPTIVQLAGWTSPYTAFGRSLFDNADGARRGALCTLSKTVVYVEEDGWVHHTLSRRVEDGTYESGADLDAIERRMLSLIQTSFGLYLRNQLCPADSVQGSPP